MSTKNTKSSDSRYSRVCNQLRIQDDLRTKSGRPIIPPPLRKFVVEKFHDSTHLGSEKLYHLISERFYWSNLFKYIRNIREILRTFLYSKQMAQKNWAKQLGSLVFALNTTSSATKLTPYEIVYGRNPVLTVDLYFGTSDKYMETDAMSPKDYQGNARDRLRDLYESVRTQLKISRDRMKKQYDTNINHHNYEIGDRVWLKKKNFKIGESRKLSPRKTGP